MRRAEKYANPGGILEYTVLSELALMAFESNNEITEDLMSRVREVYGLPLRDSFPDRFLEEKRDEFPKPWEVDPSFKRYRTAFHTARRIVLKELYNGKTGYDRVAEYWQSQREIK